VSGIQSPELAIVFWGIAIAWLLAVYAYGPIRSNAHVRIWWGPQPESTTPPRTGPPAPGHAPAVPQYGRNLLPSTVTPDYLISLRRDNLATQAEGLVKPFLGRWINVAEPVSDVSPDNAGITQVTLTRGPVVTVYLEFDTAKWGAHLALLKKGQVLSASGFLKEVTGLWVRLSACEIPL